MASGRLVQSTSRDSAVVEDISLDDAEEEAVSLTRRILRATLVNNVHDARQSVKACIMHQRRSNLSEVWKDADSYNLATMKSSQQVRLQLSAAQTKRLVEAIDEMYQVSEGGIPGKKRYIVVDEDEVVPMTEKARATIQLIEQQGEAFWDAVEQLKPDLLTVVAIKRQHDVRNAALDQFRRALTEGDWTEPDWQRFFQNNTWIFGHGLAYQFLDPITGQPAYGGTRLDGSGGQRGDFLMATRADARFTVIVEIKTPGASLVSDSEYRRKVYEMGKDVVGGVSQLQSNCRTWVLEGSRQEGNADALREAGIFTYEPKAILVVGHLKQLTANRDRLATFELYRRNLHNPEILTFDELFQRAEYLASQDKL